MRGKGDVKWNVPPLLRNVVHWQKGGLVGKFLSQRGGRIPPLAASRTFGDACLLAVLRQTRRSNLVELLSVLVHVRLYCRICFEISWSKIVLGSFVPKLLN